MRPLLMLLLAIPVTAAAQERAGQDRPGRKPVTPTVLVRDTCDLPQEPVARNVFAITCGTNEVLLMAKVKRNGETETVWERHPIEELKRLTEGVRYSVIREPRKP